MQYGRWLKDAVRLDFEVAGTELCGREQIRPFYVSSMDRYHTMLHTPEIHLVTIEDDSHAS